MRSFVALFALATCAFTNPALAQEESAAAARDGTHLTLTVEGAVEGRPDLATIHIGVQTEGATAGTAMADNARRMNAVTQALRQAGVADRDIQTSNLNVRPHYHNTQGQPPRMIGYRASNMVAARVRNMQRLSQTVDAAVAAGGNVLYGVSFSLQNSDAPRDEARRQAVAEARRLANLYAETAGLRVRRIISISDNGVQDSQTIDVGWLSEYPDRNVPGTPLERGEIVTRARVVVAFELQ